MDEVDKGGPEPPLPKRQENDRDFIPSSLTA